MDETERLFLYKIIGMLVRRIDPSERSVVHISEAELQLVEPQFVWIQNPGVDENALTLRYIHGDDGSF